MAGWRDLCVYNLPERREKGVEREKRRKQWRKMEVLKWAMLRTCTTETFLGVYKISSVKVRQIIRYVEILDFKNLVNLYYSLNLCSSSFLFYPLSYFISNQLKLNFIVRINYFYQITT